MHAAPAAHGSDRICKDYTKGVLPHPERQALSCLQLEAAASWVLLILCFSCFLFFWPSQLQPRQLLSTAGKCPDTPSHKENEAKGRPHKPKPDAVNNIPGEEPTAQSSVLLLGEGKNKQTLSTAVTVALPRQDPSFCWSC